MYWIPKYSKANEAVNYIIRRLNAHYFFLDKGRKKLYFHLFISVIHFFSFKNFKYISLVKVYILRSYLIINIIGNENIDMTIHRMILFFLSKEDISLKLTVQYSLCWIEISV